MSNLLKLENFIDVKYFSGLIKLFDASETQVRSSKNLSYEPNSFPLFL